MSNNIRNLSPSDQIADLRRKVECLKQDLSVTNNLITNSSQGPDVLLGEVSQLNTNQTSGTLIIGEVYTIGSVVAGDDFTNVGRVNGNPFVATGTTPNSWANGSTATRNQRVLRIDSNNIDPNITSKTIVQSFNATCQITITNNKFSQPLKVFTSNVTSTVLDSNNLTLSIGRFKLEVYP